MFDDIISKYATAYNVPEIWIRGVIATESSWRPDVISSDGGYGLMQLMPATAAGLGYSGTLDGLLDPDTNIQLGTKLLGQLRVRWGDDVQAVYSAYNSGSGTSYLSSAQVAKHVQNFLSNLESAIASSPVVASTGSLSIILVALILWYWKKGKK